MTYIRIIWYIAMGLLFIGGEAFLVALYLGEPELPIVPPPDTPTLTRRALTLPETLDPPEALPEAWEDVLRDRNGIEYQPTTAVESKGEIE